MVSYCYVLRLHKTCKPIHVSGTVKCIWSQVHSIGHHTQNHPCPRSGGSIAHSIPETPISKMSIIRERKVLCVQVTQVLSLLQLSRQKILYEFLISFHLILHYLIALPVLQKSKNYEVVQCVIFSTPQSLPLLVLLSTQLSNTLNLCSPPGLRNQDSEPYQI
jgi:hypothetical protein